MRNKNLYPENWNDTIRPSILKRDNYKCVLCGVKHRSYIFIDQSHKRILITKLEHDELKLEGMRTYRIYLQVSHIDNNKSNCVDSNLRSLCNMCHYLQDKEWKRLKRLSNSIDRV